MTNTFERTRGFHSVSGVEFPSSPIVPTPEEVKLGMGLITEELLELMVDGFGLSRHKARVLRELMDGAVEECANNAGSIYDMAGTVDALADLDVVINRFGGVLGFDMNKASEVVYKSNMSKFTSDEAEASEAAMEYARTGRDVIVDSRVISDEGNPPMEVFIIKDAATGKILKAKSFVEPDFGDML